MCIFLFIETYAGPWKWDKWDKFSIVELNERHRWYSAA